MKLRLCINGKVIVAGGSGVAMTIFVGEDGVGRLSLAASDPVNSGEYVTSFWVEDQPLGSGELVSVDMVDGIETTPPSIRRRENSKDRLEAQKQYCRELLASEATPEP